MLRAHVLADFVWSAWLSSMHPVCRFISQCDLVQGVPPALRAQAARIIGGKTALLTRIDAANSDPTGVRLRPLWAACRRVCGDTASSGASVIAIV